MSNSLKVERAENAGVTRISLAGDITEEARFDSVGPFTDQVVLDLSGIARINSCGVREWIQFIRAVPKGTRIAFERCPQTIVAQANMISNFLGGGRIRSFVAPYYCPKCDRAVEILLEAERDFSGKEPKAPARTCDKCGGPLDFDDVEDSYLAFLKE
jgi:anti-anti-sigma regulatory factor